MTLSFFFIGSYHFYWVPCYLSSFSLSLVSYKILDSRVSSLTLHFVIFGLLRKLLLGTLVRAYLSRHPNTSEMKQLISFNSRLFMFVRVIVLCAIVHTVQCTLITISYKSLSNPIIYFPKPFSSILKMELQKKQTKTSRNCCNVRLHIYLFNIYRPPSIVHTYLFVVDR